MKLFVEDIAFETMQTLLSTDQRELLERAEDLEIEPEVAVAQVSFKFAEAFLAEAQLRRYKRS